MRYQKFKITFLIIILTFGCTEESKPTKVTNKITFGHYEISPPMGYWYFPRRYPNKFNNPDDLFLLTFYKNKDAIAIKNAENVGLFFNVGVTQNRYNDIEKYYDEARNFGIEYEELPIEANNLLNLDGWSCKQIIASGYGIECISLRDNLITIMEFGENKEIVLNEISLLVDTINSFKY